MPPFAGTITYFLYPLFFSLSILKAEPIVYACGSIASDTPYQGGVIATMNMVAHLAPGPGFSTKIVRDVVGYALCRGDVNDDDCRSCVQEASETILGQCLQSTDAFIYYDYCYIRYLPLEHTNKFMYDSNIYYCSYSSIHISDPVQFNAILNNLFGSIAASAPIQRRQFAAAYIGFGEHYVLYGYAQCFNDMAGPDCNACINSLTFQLPNSCTFGYAGGRLVGGSCLLRFEIYYFLNW